MIVLILLISYSIIRNTKSSEKLVTPNFALNTLSIFGNSNQKPATNNSPTLKDNVEALKLPQTSFQSWSGFNAIKVPETSSVYELKDRFTVTDVKTLAYKLSAFDTVKDYENFVMSYTIGKKGQVASLLLFNKNTGEFSYKATDGVPLSLNKKTIEDKIYDFLKKIEWYDPTLKIIAQYKLRSDPDSIYFEIKRDWQSAGLPILNPVGLLNLDVNQSIDNLELNDRSTSLSRNNDYYDTSDNKDGLERNADFNTMVIGVSDKTDSVVVVKSNVRRMEKQEGTKSAVIPYEKAVSMLKNNEKSFILTTPSSIGNVNEWTKIYPNQLAEAKQAEVSESALAYLEQSPSAGQKKLEPYYIFRGTATLTNNYQINFIAAVPAISTTQARIHNPFSFSLIPQVYAVMGDVNNPIGQLGNQKQGAFDLAVTPQPPPTATPAFQSCLPSKDSLNPYREQISTNSNILGRVGYGWSPVAVINGEIQLSKRGWWYYVPAPGTTEANLRNDLNQVLVQIQQFSGRRDFRNFNTGNPPNILSDFQATGTSCPIRVTGDSPTIFIYTPPNTHLTIKPPASIAYAEPILQNQKWNIVSEGNGSFKVDGIHKDFLYYEYTDTVFSRPASGWNTSKRDLTSLGRTIISPLLGLNSQEENRLVYEINHAADKVDSNRLFIGIVDQKELSVKLPLTISPSIKMNRYMFYVGIVEDDHVVAPKLNSIVRSNSMIVELGSYAEK